MVTTSKTIIRQICPRCGRDLIFDPEGPYCFTHGTISPDPIEQPIQAKSHTPKIVNQDFVPPKPAGRNLHMIHKYYKENRQLILEDIQMIGEEATCKKWKIARSSFERHFR